MRKYTILYKVMDPKDISDLVAVGNPKSGNRQIKVGGGYTYGSRSLKNVRNPNICWPHTGDFFPRLEESILKEGFRNPIFCIVTDEGIFSVYGMSRLWLAKHHNLPVPSIIADYTGKYTGLELHNKEDILDYYTEKPKHCMVEDDHIEIMGMRPFSYA